MLWSRELCVNNILSVTLAASTGHGELLLVTSRRHIIAFNLRSLSIQWSKKHTNALSINMLRLSATLVVHNDVVLFTLFNSSIRMCSLEDGVLITPPGFKAKEKGLGACLATDAVTQGYDHSLVEDKLYL